MSKDKLTDYSSTADSNTDIGGISIAEGMSPSAVNNAIREQMSHQKEAFGSGTPLYVDQTNNRVGIGSVSPDALLQIEKSDSGTTIDKEPSSQSGPNVVIHNSNQTANNLSSVQFTNRGTNGVAETATAGIHVKHEAQGGTYSYGSMNFNTTNSAGSYSTRMTIDSNGGVQINTTSGNEFLNVHGAIGTSAASAAFGAGLERAIMDFTGSVARFGHVNGASGSARNVEFMSGGSTKMRLNASGTEMFVNQIAGFNDNNTKISFGALTGSTLQFFTGGSERGRFTTSGFAVGKTSLGDATAVGAELSTIGYGMFSRSDNIAIYANRGDTGTLVWFGRAGANKGDISVSSTAVAFNTTSDRRLKSNIEDAASASDKIDAIQVRQFDWNADNSHQDYGLIAQELQPIEPLAVTGDADSDEMMAVDYSKLVPMLIKEIQELRGRVAALEAN